jgi:hypothetical protein
MGDPAAMAAVPRGLRPVAVHIDGQSIDIAGQRAAPSAAARGPRGPRPGRRAEGAPGQARGGHARPPPVAVDRRAGGHPQGDAAAFRDFAQHHDTGVCAQPFGAALDAKGRVQVGGGRRSRFI